MYSRPDGMTINEEIEALVQSHVAPTLSKLESMEKRPDEVRSLVLQLARGKGADFVVRGG